jgi:hypothetical protein
MWKRGIIWHDTTLLSLHKTPEILLSLEWKANTFSTVEKKWWHVSIFVLILFFYLTFLLVYISCTGWFHCDISICACNVPWLVSPPSSLFLIPHLLFLKVLFQRVSLLIVTQVYKVHWPYSPSFTLSLHSPPPKNFPPNKTCFTILSFIFNCVLTLNSSYIKWRLLS